MFLDFLVLFEGGIRDFVASNYSLVATGDHESPINAGSFILKPLMRDWEQALSLLHNPFSVSMGYNVGRPKELYNAMSASGKRDG